MILDEFKHNNNFEKEDILKNNNGKLPEKFDEDFEFLKKLVFRNDNFDPNVTVSGKLWLREIFL